MSDFLSATTLPALVFTLQGTCLFANAAAHRILPASVQEEIAAAISARTDGLIATSLHVAGRNLSVTVDRRSERILVLGSDSALPDGDAGFGQDKPLAADHAEDSWGPADLGSPTWNGDRIEPPALKHHDSASTVTPDNRDVASDWREHPRFRTLFQLPGEMAHRIREFEWGQTELGPLHSWPPPRLKAVLFILKSPLAMTAYTGPNSIVIYNDAYIKTMGPLKHPHVLGTPASQAWAEIWDAIRGPLEAAQQGVPHLELNHQMLWHRLRGSNPMEEVWCDWSYNPLEHEGEIVSNIHIMSEIKTLHPITSRRNEVLGQIASNLATVRDTIDLCRKACTSLSQLPYDLPYCLAYTCGPAEASLEELESQPFVRISSAGSSTSRGSAEDVLCFSLQETVGLDFDTPASPSRIVLDGASRGAEDGLWTAAFRKMTQTRRPVEVEGIGGLLAGATVRGLDHIQSDRAVCLPLLYNNEIFGCFVLFLAPTLSYDSHYKAFLSVVLNQLSLILSVVKSIEEETQKAEDMAALDRAKTAFFTGVSHELRTPLTLILGPARDLVNAKGLSKKQSSEMLLIYRNARRLLRLVNSILDFSRAAAGKLNSTFSPLPLSLITAELCASFRGAIENAGIEYIFEDTVPSDQLVFVDFDRFERIVFNLVSNAFKFCREGFIKIRTSLSDEGSHWLLQVQDSGIGIPTDQLSLVFERFHRVENKNARVAEGSGIGLSLCLEFVKLLGGMLSVDSIEGKGTTFTVSLPLGSSHIPKSQLSMTMPTHGGNIKSASFADTIADLAEDISGWGKAASVSQSQSDTDDSPPTTSGGSFFPPILGYGDGAGLVRPRMLLAEDNADMRQYIANILSPYVEMVQVTDGEEAFNQLQGPEPFQLLLSDVVMPRCSGIELLARIRADERLKDLQVMLLSARGGEDAGLDALQSGANHYLAKPFSSKELLIRTHQQLQLAAVRVTLEQRVKERTQELEQERESFKRLGELLGVGVHRSDPSGRVTWANRKWHQVINLPDDAIDTWDECIAEKDRASAREAYMAAVASGKGYDRPQEVTLVTGNVQTDVVYDLQPEENSMGHVTGFIGTFTDVTALRNLEKARVELERTRREEAEASRNWSESFIDIFAHELRNPLNAIYNSAEILFESISKFRDASKADTGGRILVPPEQLDEDLEALNTILLCSKHQKSIADDVLRISKLSANLVELNPAPFHPLASTEETLSMFKVETSVKKIALVMASHHSISSRTRCVADGTRFQQVMINLLANAIKFCGGGYHRKEVTLSMGLTRPLSDKEYETMTDNAQDWRDALSFCSKVPPFDLQPGQTVFLHGSVTDSGAGMSEQEQGLVFKRFSQAKPRSHQDFGSGLGLWISRRLVELNSGKIVLHSKERIGTVFRFYFAVQLATTEEPMSYISTSSPVLSNPQTMEDRTPSALRIDRPSILVVEDNRVNQQVLCRLLKRLDCDTVTADNGQDCLDKLTGPLQSKREGAVFDCILMDLEMPILNGLEATRAIRVMEANGRLKGRHTIIAVSANAREHYVDESFSAGMDGYLRKPYTKAELEQVIRTFCKSRT